MTAAHAKPKRFRIDDLLVDAGSRKVLRGDEPVDLSRLSFDLLLALIEAAPDVVTTDELVKAVWGDVIVSDETVTQRVKVLRDALDQDGDKQRYVETVRSVGYRLRSEVIAEEPAHAAAPVLDRLTRSPRTTWAALAILALVIVSSTLFLSAEQTPVSEPAEKSIAVLPFVAMSSGEDDGYFADGLTEEILNALTQVPELLVTARTSAFVFKGRDVPVPAIAEALGVAHLVQGTVRRSDDRLRVTAQLVRAADGLQVWSDSFDHEAKDTISVQIEIAEKIAAALDILLDDARKERMRAAGVRDPEAFIAYQKGVEILNAAHGSPEMLSLLAEANEYFEAAIERAPDFSDAYLQHADYFSHVILGIASGRSPDGFGSDDVAKLRAVLVADFDAAVRYAPDEQRRVNAEFDRALITGDWVNLDSRISKVLGEPGCRLPIWFDVVALPYGDIERSVATFHRALECNPLDFVARIHDLRLALWRGVTADASDASTIETGTDANAALRTARITSLLAMGRFDEAETMINRELGNVASTHYLSFLLAAARGDAVDASAQSQRGYSGALGMAHPDAVHKHALLGDRDNSNRLAAAIDGRPFGHLVLAITVLTCFCGAPFDLEVTPNFARMIEQAGFAWPPSSPIEWPLKSW